MLGGGERERRDLHLAHEARRPLRAPSRDRERADDRGRRAPAWDVLRREAAALCSSGRGRRPHAGAAELARNRHTHGTFRDPAGGYDPGGWWVEGRAPPLEGWGAVFGRRPGSAVAGQGFGELGQGGVVQRHAVAPEGAAVARSRSRIGPASSAAVPQRASAISSVSSGGQVLRRPWSRRARACARGRPGRRSGRRLSPRRGSASARLSTPSSSRASRTTPATKSSSGLDAAAGRSPDALGEVRLADQRQPVAVEHEQRHVVAAGGVVGDHRPARGSLTSPSQSSTAGSPKRSRTRASTVSSTCMPSELPEECEQLLGRRRRGRPLGRGRSGPRRDDRDAHGHVETVEPAERVEVGGVVACVERRRSPLRRAGAVRPCPCRCRAGVGSRAPSGPSAAAGPRGGPARRRRAARPRRALVVGVAVVEGDARAASRVRSASRRRRRTRAGGSAHSAAGVELEAVLADVADAVDSDDPRGVVGRPAAHARDEPVRPDEPSAARRASPPGRPRAPGGGDRRERAVDVEEQRGGSWILGEALQEGADEHAPRIGRCSCASSAIGLAAGFFGALFGVGGGIVMVPLLIGVAAFAARNADGDVARRDRADRARRRGLLRLSRRSEAGRRGRAGASGGGRAR